MKLLATVTVILFYIGLIVAARFLYCYAEMRPFLPKRPRRKESQDETPESDL